MEKKVPERGNSDVCDGDKSLHMRLNRWHAPLAFEPIRSIDKGDDCLVLER